MLKEPLLILSVLHLLILLILALSRCQIIIAFEEYKTSGCRYCSTGHQLKGNQKFMLNLCSKSYCNYETSFCYKYLLFTPIFDITCLFNNYVQIVIFHCDMSTFIYYINSLTNTIWVQKGGKKYVLKQFLYA